MKKLINFLVVFLSVQTVSFTKSVHSLFHKFFNLKSDSGMLYADWTTLKENDPALVDYLKVLNDSDSGNRWYTLESLQELIKTGRELSFYDDGNLKIACCLATKRGIGVIVHGSFSGTYLPADAFKIFWRRVRSYMDANGLNEFYAVRKKLYDDNKISRVHEQAFLEAWETQSDPEQLKNGTFEKVTFVRSSQRKLEDETWTK